jgi:hypothetical protein
MCRGVWWCALVWVMGCGTASVKVEPSPALVDEQPPVVVSQGDTANDADTDALPEPDPTVRVEGEDVTISVFDAEHVFFGSENRRSVEAEVTLPAADTTYGRITGRFRLHCPSGLCDHWDRYGTFGFVTDAGTDAAEYVELDRFITAYRTGHQWSVDLTDMRPALTGTTTLRVHIDTWVGPGHAEGSGWLFDAALEFEGGPPPSPEPVEIIGLWPHARFDYGVADNPVSSQVPPRDITPVAGSHYKLRSFISGHGFGGLENCAEFCAKEHGYDVGGLPVRRVVWRDDCHTTVTDSVQYGTWQYARAGWCPGAQVHAWDTDVTAAFSGSDPVQVSYSVQNYTWNNQGGQPYFYMSGVMVRYE